MTIFRRTLGLLLLAACAPSPEDGVPTAADTGEGQGTTATERAPTDLTLSIVLAGADAYNPDGDGSGVAELRAEADGAVQYVFTIGEGESSLISTSGVVGYTFDQEGSHSHTVRVTALAASGEAATVTTSVVVYVSLDAFPTLVWADEFEEDGTPDPEKWHPQVLPPLEGGWYNGELQHYTARPENASVSDGTLKIVARREAYTIEGSTRSFTSARLNSRYAFTYGRVEVRARLPASAGTWPAIWTLGANIDERGNAFGSTYGSVGWPACGEIDIMEQRGWDKATTLAYFHWGNTKTGAYESEGSTLANPDAVTAFHVYTLVWTEAALTVWVDDQLVHTLENTAARPYDNPHYLLLNLAVGGNLGGEVPASFTEDTLEIDYVRIYQ